MQGMFQCDVNCHVALTCDRSETLWHTDHLAQRSSFTWGTHCSASTLLMRGRAVRLLPGAQPVLISSCCRDVRAVSDMVAATVTAEDGSGSGSSNSNTSTMRQPLEQPHSVAHPSWWLPAPPPRCVGGQWAGAMLRHAAPERTSRHYSSSASNPRPTLKAQLRELYKRVHPDRFQDHPAAQVCKRTSGQGD